MIVLIVTSGKGDGEEIESLHKNGLWRLVKLPPLRKQLGANGCMQRRNDLSEEIIYVARHGC